MDLRPETTNLGKVNNFHPTTISFNIFSLQQLVLELRCLTPIKMWQLQNDSFPNVLLILIFYKHEKSRYFRLEIP